MGEELAVELLGLADRYLLDGLKLLCGFTLARMVSVESVSRIILAADRCDSLRHPPYPYPYPYLYPSPSPSP